jgi:murein DD-endopeptidase MepM/ murein hydrolase activator NlpD
MIYLRGSISFLLLMALIGLFPHSAYASERIHVVVRGDTIFSLSRTYQVSQDELMRHNGITDASRLTIGMRLVIPGRTNNAPAASVRTEIIVSPNDTLFGIARRYGVSLQSLRDINGFSVNHILRAGERIRIPQPAAGGAAIAGAAPVGNTIAAIGTPAAAVDPAPVIVTPVQRTPAQPAARTIAVDPSIRWPIVAREIHLMNGNSGVRIAGIESESIRSLTRGTVIHAGPWRGYGHVAIVETEEGYKFLYGASETLSVRKGDFIEPGTELGKLGIYPGSGRPELVFMVARNGSLIDPVLAPRS